MAMRQVLAMVNNCTECVMPGHEDERRLAVARVAQSGGGGGGGVGWSGAVGAGPSGAEKSHLQEQLQEQLHWKKSIQMKRDMCRESYIVV